MAPSGECVARHEGLVLFVAMGIPGERVEVEIVHRRKTWARARITRVIAPSPQRVAPPCSYFGHCGGCEWQHIDYAAQVAYKAGIVREQLARLGGIADVNVLPCVPSPRDYGYRNRIQLIASRKGKPGYRARQSHDVVEIDRCPIAEESLNALLPAAQAGAGEMLELRAHDAGPSTSSPPLGGGSGPARWRALRLFLRAARAVMSKSASLREHLPAWHRIRRECSPRFAGGLRLRACICID